MIRSALKRGLQKVINRGEAAPPSAPVAPVARATAPEVVPPAPAPAPAPPPAPVAVAAPVVAAPVVAAPVVAAPMADTDDTAGPAISLEQVQVILDDMVRPALQGDGGDITLLKVEDNNIYVKLVGSCKSCPSSIMTMKLGVEALLKEEFPAMKELIQVD